MQAQLIIMGGFQVAPPVAALITFSRRPTADVGDSHNLDTGPW